MRKFSSYQDKHFMIHHKYYNRIVTGMTVDINSIY